jgi:hypothetical protein
MDSCSNIQFYMIRIRYHIAMIFYFSLICRSDQHYCFITVTVCDGDGLVDDDHDDIVWFAKK